MISISDNHNSSRVTLFNGTNFENWKYRLEILLDTKGLRHYIQEDLDSILSGAEATKHDEIKQQEKKCKQIIIESIDDDQLEYTKDVTFAKQMIDNFKAVYQRKSVASQLLLRKQLLTLKMHEGEAINDHFLKFDKLIRNLKSVGATMEDLDIICHLLLTLPKSYDNLVTAIETMNPKEITLEFVKSRLLEESRKRGNGEKSGTSSGGHAMHARNPDIICFLCGKKGHIKSMCKSKHQKKVNKSQTSQRHKGDAANVVSGDKECSLCAFDENDLIECANTCGEHDACRDMNEHVGHTNDATQIKFVLDSGATEHMVNGKRYFSELTDIDDITISVAKRNQRLVAKQRGSIKIRTFCNGNSDVKTMKSVLLIEDLKCNLMSINVLTNRGYTIQFENDCAYVSHSGKLQFIAYKKGKLYEVTFLVDSGDFAGLSCGQSKGKVSQNLLHFRLGHLNVTDMKRMISRNMVSGLENCEINTDKKFCETCILGKHSKSSFPRNERQRSERVLELVHTDVCGPMSQPAWDKSRYFVTFTDDYTRASMVYCIENKSDVFEIFKQYVAMAESYHGVKVASLKSDNGGEYSSNNFKNFCKEKGIRIRYTVPYNPEMNSISERLNRTLQEKARSMLLASGIDWRFWNEAVVAANYLKNRSPTSAYGKRFINKTPAELWYGKRPDMSNIRIFGTICYNHIPADHRKRLDAKSSKCIMLGYGTSHHTYRLWDIELNKLLVGRHVIFNEGSVLNRTKTIEIPIKRRSRTTMNRPSKWTKRWTQRSSITPMLRMVRRSMNPMNMMATKQFSTVLIGIVPVTSKSTVSMKAPVTSFVEVIESVVQWIDMVIGSTTHISHFRLKNTCRTTQCL